MGSCLAAWAGEAPLRVVTTSSFPPYVYMGADGRPEGYLIDLWQLWEQKTGTAVDLRPMPWSQAQRTLIDGEADVIDLIYRTPVREQLYEFSAPYATLPVGIYVDSSIRGIHDANTMKGFAIGVQRGDACVDELTRLGVQRLTAYPDYAAILNAAKAGDIKMFCMDDEPANYYLYLQRDSLKFYKAFTLYEGRPHWAVARGQGALYKQVSEGMERISAEEREALRRKWLSHPIQFQPYVLIAAAALSGVLLVVAGASLWIWLLRRLVRDRTQELSRKNQALETASAQLQIERAQLRTIVDSTPDAIALKDAAGLYVDCNARMQGLMGLPREHIIGHSDEQVISDAALVAVVQEQDQLVRQLGQPVTCEIRMVGPDGAPREVEMIKVPIRSGADGLSRVLTALRDITERRHAERELRIAAVAFESQDGMLITDASGRIERVNAAFSRITGYPATEVIGQRPTLLKSNVHERPFFDAMWSELRHNGYWSGEVVNRHRQGRLYTARLSITAVADEQGEINHYIGHFQDLSAEKQAQALAEHLKLFDSLTDLPNRTLLEELMEGALDTSVRQGQVGAVMMLDLDRFQQVNDALGHAVGDQLLQEVTRRIQSMLAGSDTLSRFSGDTFVLLLEQLGPDASQAAEQVGQRSEALRARLAEAMRLEQHRLVSSASIGVTLFQGRQVRAEMLLRQAELAMYRSKQNGRNRVSFFEEAMQADLARRTWLEEELRNAVEAGQLALYYQVQVDQTGQAVGAEALIRWRHPQRGMIPPAEFIGLAEESGLIEPIGQWVVIEACRQLARWAALPGLDHLSLAVNISPRQFKADHFVADILNALRQTGASADKLKLEVTESLAIDDFEASIGKLQQLRNQGFRISLDDFGTGNSSLNYLTKLPLAQLKIDKSFIDELPDDHRDAMVTQTIIAMGRGLGLDVIAEGVETRAQHDFLVSLGCHAFQGYLFGRPQPLDLFEQAQIAQHLARSRP